MPDVNNNEDWEEVVGNQVRLVFQHDDMACDCNEEAKAILVGEILNQQIPPVCSQGCEMTFISTEIDKTIKE
jgi:hypothetical protein